MEDESNLIIARELYVEKTRHRMSGITKALLAIRDDGQWQMDHLLRLLQEQAEASRQAGHESVGRLCQSMEDCLAKINGHIEKSQIEVAISALMQACQVISEHADTIASLAMPCQSEEVCL